MERIMSRKCKACGNEFQPHAKSSKQSYCSSPECQLERRRRWLREKRQVDDAYKGNEEQKVKQWRSKNQNYWKEYRKTHPDYADRNRHQQQIRNQRTRNPLIANVDDLPNIFPLYLGCYRLIRVDGKVIANVDDLILEISVISAG